MYVENKQRAVESADIRMAADMPAIEPGLLRYYIEYDRFPDSLAALVPPQPDAQFVSMPTFGRYGIYLDRVPESIENGTVEYTVSGDGQEYVLATRLFSSKESFADTLDQIAPEPVITAAGSPLGVNCADPKTFCLHGTAAELMKKNDVQVVKAPGYKIFVTGWRGRPNLYPKILLIALQTQPGVHYTIPLSGSTQGMSSVCDYWPDDPYCKSHYTAELTRGYSKEGTYHVTIRRQNAPGENTTLGVADVVVTYDTIPQ